MAKKKPTLTERYDAATDALCSLPPEHAAEVICGALNLAKAKLREPHHGALCAAQTAVRAVLGAEHDAVLARRLADVAQGARLQSTTQNVAPTVRRLAGIIDAAMAAAVGGTDDAARIVLRVARRELDTTGNVKAIAEALGRKRRNARIAGVAAALRLVPDDPSGVDVVRRALAR